MWVYLWIGQFTLEPVGSDLTETGEYRIWVDEVFTFAVKPAQFKLQLPTAEHPRTFRIIPEKLVPESNQQVIMGALIGCVLALCVALLLYYLRRDPNGAKKLLLSFMRTEAKMAANMAERK